MRKAIIKGFALLAIAVLLGTIPMGAHAEYRYHKVEFEKEYRAYVDTDTNTYDVFYFDVHANQEIVISVKYGLTQFVDLKIVLFLGEGNRIDWNNGTAVKHWAVEDYYPKIAKQFVNFYYNVTAEDVKKYGDGKTVRAFVWADSGNGEYYKIKINVYDKGMGVLNVFMMAIIIAGVVLAVVAIAVLLWRKKK